MKKFEVHFTVHRVLTTFKEVIEADEVDRDAFRKILNERLKAEGVDSTVNEIFLIVESTP
jgi:hypothetical protein